MEILLRMLATLQVAEIIALQFHRTGRCNVISIPCYLRIFFVITITVDFKYGSLRLAWNLYSDHLLSL
jgi:hypothetical protein